jgi:signal transduction histidine kinase
VPINNISIKNKGIRVLTWYLLFIAIPFKQANGQTIELDSLKRLVKTGHQQDTAKVNTLNKLAYAIYPYDTHELKQYSEQALALSRKLNYKKGEATAYKNIALALMLVHGDAAALNYLDTAYSILRPLNDRVAKASILNYIGCYYATVKARQQAVMYFNEALDELKGMDLSLELMILNNLGNHYQDVGQLSRAKTYFDKMLVLATGLPDKNKLVLVYLNFASLLYTQKIFTEAIAYCNKAQEIIKQYPINLRTIEEVYLQAADIEVQLRNYKLARSFYTKSADIGKQMKSVEYMDKIYHGLYLIDSLNGNYGSALGYFYKYQQVRDSVLNLDKNRQIALYQVKFDVQKRQEENKHLKTIDQNNQIIITHQRTTLSIAMFSIIIICIGLVYLEHINKQIKAKNKLINEQNQLLNDGNKTKDILFSVIAHDLRTPISQVIGLLDVWKEGDISTEEMEDLAEAIKKGGQNTLSLLDNLLIWSKSQLQGFDFAPGLFNICELAEDVLSKMQPSIDQKKINIKNDLPQAMMVFADDAMITIVMRNLVSNAVKFTPESGTIQLTGTEKDGFAVIGVIDSGVGIKDDDLAKIFFFTSFTSLGTANEKGTGLGLKICSDFLKINNGLIWVESKENEGSKFYFTIPLNS